MRSFPASILLNFNPVDSTDTPTFTSLVDDTTGTSATLTVVGSGTVRAYYRVRGETLWVSGITRSGSGSMQQTGLAKDTWYDFYITDEVSGLAESAPTQILSVKITDGLITAIEISLVSLLESDGEVSGLVDSRVYPATITQSASLPAITYQQITGPRDETMSGPSGLVESRWQFNCWARTYGESRFVADAVRRVLDGYRGTVNTIVIQRIQFEDEGDIPIIPAGVEVAKRFAKRLDFVIWYNETVGS